MTAALVGFVLGLALMLAIKLFSNGGGGHGAGSSTSLVVTAGVDTLVDGFVIGLGFVVGGGTGALLAVALAVELFFLGLSASASVGQSGRAPRLMLAVGAGLGLLVMVGSVAGVVVLGGASESVVTAVLAFGAIALLYLVTEELLRQRAQRPRDALAHARALLGLYPGVRHRDACPLRV